MRLFFVNPLFFNVGISFFRIDRCGQHDMETLKRHSVSAAGQALFDAEPWRREGKVGEGSLDHCLFAKTGVNDRLELALFALKNLFVNQTSEVAAPVFSPAAGSEAAGF